MDHRFEPDDLRRCLITALGSLRAHQAAIDDSNVYPVADGDTGTNMMLTMSAAAEALDADDPFVSVPRGALQGARGNSGVILAQILRGFCEGARNHDLQLALKRAAELAYQAVLEPVEGTMLSVIRAAADSGHGSTPAEILEHATNGARIALDETPNQLRLLKDAGVVDAGGTGVWVMLDAFAAAVSNRSPVAPPKSLAPHPIRDRESGSPQFAYEVQYLLEAPDVQSLRPKLGAIGDSVVISGGGGLWNVHVHTNDIEQAVALGRELGAVRSESISSFADQLSGSRAVPLSKTDHPVSVIAVAHGDGFKALFAELGAGAVLDAGPFMNPSAEQIAETILQAAASDVIILPNSPAAADAAREAAQLVNRRRAEIVETFNLAQGVTTMLAYGDARDLATNAAQMRQAASVAATASVVHVAHDAITPSGSVRAGQWLGEGADVRVVADDPVTCALELIHAIDAEEPVEVITVFAGKDAPADERREIERMLRHDLVGVDVEMREGGQALERYLVAAE